MQLLLTILFLFATQQEEVPIKNREAFIQKFDEVSENTTSIQCEFIQRKYISISKTPLESSGRLYFEGEKMRWEQEIPKPYLMTIKGERLKIKEDGNVKEHVMNDNKYMKGLREIMIGSMTGNLLKSNQFETDLMENEVSWIVNMTPRLKRVKKMFSHIKMKFNRETYRMEQVILTEANGDHTDIFFLNPVFNKDVPDHLFNL